MERNMARKRAYPENILHDLQADGVTENVLKYDHLTDRERAVIRLYYIENTMTRKEVADEFGVSEQRIRQIISKALRKIRKNANIKITQRIKRQ